MTVKPTSEGKNPELLYYLCFAGAAISGLSSYLVGMYDWAFQFMTVVFLTAGLYLFVRYHQRYEYRIWVRKELSSRLTDGFSDDVMSRTLATMEPSELEFSVKRISGKAKPVVECRFYLSELVSVEHLSCVRRERRAQLKAAGDLRLYTYTVSMDPPNAYLLVFSAEGYGKIGVVVEPDEGMAALLQAKCGKCGPTESTEE